MLFGARIADGCTSGHGLSGMAQLSVGSTVAVAAMFAGGIVTALAAAAPHLNTGGDDHVVRCTRHLRSALLMGIVFGFALEKSRVFEPGVIVGQMQLRNFIMLKVFLTAVATGAVVLAVLNGFGFVKLQPKAALYAADIVGGLILGVGIALAGACPGTTLAQIGVGYRDAMFTLLGGLCRRGRVLLRPAVAGQVADRHRAAS